MLNIPKNGLTIVIHYLCLTKQPFQRYLKNTMCTKDAGAKYSKNSQNHKFPPHFMVFSGSLPHFTVSKKWSLEKIAGRIFPISEIY